MGYFWRWESKSLWAWIIPTLRLLEAFTGACGRRTWRAYLAKVINKQSLEEIANPSDLAVLLDISGLDGL
jgi:hypothetical protein